MKKTLLALLFLLAPSIAGAQQSTVQTLMYNYDLTVTAVNYPSFGPQLQGVGTVTAAASTTLTADLTASTPFSQISVGSMIVIQTAPNTFITRTVTAKASSISLTLSGAAVTVTSVPWRYSVFTIGTGATNGWVPTQDSDYIAVEYDFTTMSGTGGIDTVIQCQLNGLATTGATIYGTPTVVNVPSASTFIVPLGEKCDKVRVGVFWHTAATGTDVLNLYVHTWQAQ